MKQRGSDARGRPVGVRLETNPDQARPSGARTPQSDLEFASTCRRGDLDRRPSALTGHFRPHHAFRTTQILAHLDHLEEAVATLSERIATILAPFADAVQRLDTIPGVNQCTAEVLVAEIGVDMTRFPSDRHLASWAGLCPGNHESAGKHKSGKTRKGNIWLRGALVEAALGATRTKNSAVAARYRRVLRHRGHKKAIVAVAHSLLVTAYYVLAHQTMYRVSSAPTTTTTTIPNASQAGPCTPSSSRAIESRWNAPRDRDSEVIF